MPFRKLLIDSQQLPENAILYFWDIIELTDRPSDEKHVLFNDNPSTGGWDANDTVAQLACTNEEIYQDEYRIVPARRATIRERMESITCEKCQDKVKDGLFYSGAFEENYRDFI